MSLHEELMASKYANQLKPPRIRPSQHPFIGSQSSRFFPSGYKGLAEAIPEYMAVIDFGCCNATQGYFFRNHAAYIGVEHRKQKFFKVDNGQYFIMRIEEYLNNHCYDCYTDSETGTFPVFAICQYVPCIGVDNANLVKSQYRNCYVMCPDFVP